MSTGAAAVAAALASRRGYTSREAQEAALRDPRPKKIFRHTWQLTLGLTIVGVVGFFCHSLWWTVIPVLLASCVVTVGCIAWMVALLRAEDETASYGGWSKALPDAPGYYWTYRYKNKVFLAHVTEQGGALWVRFIPHSTVLEPIEQPQVELWLGPIWVPPTPEKP